jgi:radical SAM superfamily enzyme YgiQ (UPF0313 family)
MKLGLIAMSGIRVHNAGLAALGVTLPGFVERGRVIAGLPSLSLLTLAALTPPDIEVEYVEVSDLRSVGGLPDFDVAAISTYTAQAYETFELADRFRAAGVKVILGGLFVSQAPDEAAAHADAVVIGEAEPVWPQVIEDLRHRRLRPRYLDLQPGRYDLRLSPVPRYDLLDPERYNRITIQTHRGCPIDCGFCGASILLGKGFRQKPVQQVLRELNAVQDIWPRPFIEFADDNSFVDKRYGLELCEALEPFDVKWFTESDVSIADNDRLLEAMARSGCRQVLIGFESPRASSLHGLDARNWKLKRRPRAFDAIRRIQSHGITVNACFIVGLDGDDTAIFEETRDFIQASGAYDAQVTVPTPFPGTRLLARLRREGRLLDDRIWDRCTLFDVVFRPKRMSVDELEAGFRWLLGEIYGESAVAERRARWKQQFRGVA